MTEDCKRTPANPVRRSSHPPRQLQVAAICCRETNGETEVLLISSRGTGRWIVPKGWPIKGLDTCESALQEAWEEAGVRATPDKAEPVGHFEYEKRLDDGSGTPIRAEVFKVQIDRLENTYPEVNERKRAWFPPSEAANLVQEPDLQDILRQI